MQQRKELKFLVTESELLEIENRISGIMKPDINQQSDAYNIRSIYFDSPTNTCMQENESGVDKRCKYRIRIYNCSNHLIKAEIKSKYRDTTTKQAVRITLEQYDSLIHANHVSQYIGSNPVYDHFAQVIIGELYKPKTIVEYQRTAYTFQPCNVRVTFDRNIGSSRQYAHFFSPQIMAIPVLSTNTHILEIKYDEFLPDFLQQLLHISGTRTSFSKYYYAANIYNTL